MKTIVSVFVVIMAGWVGPAQAQHVQALQDAFTAEALSKWRKLPETLGCYRVEVEKVERRKEVGAGEAIVRSHYSSLSSGDGRFRSTVEDDLGGVPFAKAISVNDRYSFLLSRTKSGGSWLLDRIDLHPSQAADAEIGGFKLRQAWNSVFPWLTINPNLDLIDLVTNPTFKIVSATERPTGGKTNEVRIEFTATNLVKKVIEEKYTGWMQFDRTRLWALTSYDLAGTSPRDGGGRWTVTEINQFMDHPKALPILIKSVKEHNGYRLPNTLVVTVKTESDYRYDDKDCPKENEFELSAFGLPEPVGVAPPRNRLHWWFIGTGVMIAVIGYFLLKRFRRV